MMIMMTMTIMMTIMMMVPRGSQRVERVKRVWRLRDV
jgi:hypothetical protein